MKKKQAFLENANSLHLLLITQLFFLLLLLPTAPARAHLSGRALKFTGSQNEYASGSGILTAYRHEITLEAWIYLESMQPGTIQRFITMGQESAVLRYDGSSSGGHGQLHFYIKVDGELHSIRVDNALERYKWFHIAGTWDDGVMKLYLNGQELGSKVFAQDATLDDFDGTIRLSKTNEAMHGYLDEVRIWHQGRTREQLLSNMFRTLDGTEDQLVHYWTFDNHTSSAAMDAVGSVDLTLHDMTENDYQSSAFAGPRNAISFDGGDDHLYALHASYFEFDNVLTIELWVKPTALDGRRVLFTTRQTNRAGSYQLEIGTGSGGTNRVAVSGVGTWVAQTGDNTIAIDEWSHIAYTRTGIGAGTHKIYVNGVEQPLISDADYTFESNPDDKLFGYGINGCVSFAGEMDEIRMWADVRTARQIRENMCQVLAGNEWMLASYFRLDESDGLDITNYVRNSDVVLKANRADRYVESRAFNTFTEMKHGSTGERINWSLGDPFDSDNVGFPAVSETISARFNEDFTCNILCANEGHEIDIQPSSSVLTVNSNAFCYEHFISGFDQGRIILAGTNQHGIEGTYTRLELDDADGALCVGDVHIVETLTMTNGDLDLSGHTITLGEDAGLVETSEHVVKGSSGIIKTTRTLFSGDLSGGLNIAGLGAHISTDAALGTTTIRRGHVAQNHDTANSILRYYDINPQHNSGLDATLVFPWRDEELNGNEAADLNLFRSTDAGASWTLYGGDVDVAQHTIRLDHIDAFSRWTAFQFSEEMFVDSGIELADFRDGDVEWGDYDNDGDLDIVLLGRGEAPWETKLYRNDGNGLFTEIAGNLTEITDGNADWGDYDNDGDLDLLLVGGYQKSNEYAHIFRNDGGDTFTNIQAGLRTVCEADGAWGDYDNDGDLDVLVSGTSDTRSDNLTTFYRNDGSDSFTSITVGVEHLSSNRIAWGDYDNDGDLDILLTSISYSYHTHVYRNDGDDTFTLINAGLPQLNYSSAAWGDYDNDGDMDIVLLGEASSGRLSAIYRNDGNDSFVNINAGLEAMRFGDVAWGDFDNDGDLDLVLTGSYKSRVYRNDGSDTFADISSIIIGVAYSAVACGDYDNDGDLDLALIGDQGDPDYATTRIYNNISTTGNTAPGAPTNLSAQVTGTTVSLSWDKTTDIETPQDALTYNLRIGTSAGGFDIVSPMADPGSGYRRIPAHGVCNHLNSREIINLSPGTYYWSVQAIDNGFTGSAFATEGSFVIEEPVLFIPPGNALEFDGANDFVELPFSVASDVAGGSELTIEYWFRGSTLYAPVAIYSLIDETYVIAGVENPDLMHCIFSENMNDAVSVGDPGVVQDGTWHHLAMTWKKNTTNGFKSYVDGRLVAQANSSNADLFDFREEVTDVYLATTDGDLSFLQGELDEVRIWNVARAETELQDNMHNIISGNESGLVAYYRFDHIDGTTLDDLSTNGYHGMLKNMEDDDWVISTIPAGSIGEYVDNTTPTSVGPAGGSLKATITSTPNSTNNLGIYQHGQTDGNWITEEDFPPGVDERTEILWGVWERGNVTSTLVFDYGDISSDSEVKLLRREDRISDWTDVTTNYVHDTNANTFTQTGVSEYSEFTIARGQPETLIWNGSVSSDWDTPANWNGSNVPTDSDNIQIPASAINQPIIFPTSEAGGLNLEVENGATVTILSDATNNGSLIIEGTATGDATYKRFVSNTDWHLIAPPVANQNVNLLVTTPENDIATNGDLYGIAPYANNQAIPGWKHFTTDGGSNPASSGGNLTSGKGYEVLRNTNGTISFTGNLRTANVDYDIYNSGQGNAWNLTGNPYTAAIAVNNLTGTTNWLDRNANILDDFYKAIYIFDAETSSYVTINHSSDATYVSPGQGFFIRAIANGGTITYLPEMRSHQTGNIFVRKQSFGIFFLWIETEQLSLPNHGLVRVFS